MARLCLQIELGKVTLFGAFSVILASLCAMQVGCATKLHGSSLERLQIIEVESSHQATVAAINQTPTDFIIPTGDNYYTWQRVNFFFDAYTNGKKIVEEGDRILITNLPADDAVQIYKVLREPSGNGIRYWVQCFPASNPLLPHKIDQNCRNLARFIQTGELELSLLTTQ